MELNKNKRIAIAVIAILLGVIFAVYLLNTPYASIINYLPYINGSIFFLVGLYSFCFCFRIYTPKYKTIEKALKIDNLLRTNGKQLKFGSIFMILFGVYNLIWHDPNMYRLNSEIEKSRWTNKDKAEFIQSCSRYAGATAKKYPQIIEDYCTCSIDKIMKGMGREEYMEDLSKSAQEQFKIDSPFIEGCLIDAKRRVDSIKHQRK